MEDFKHVKEHIIRKYLLDTELHEFKKEAIRNFLKQMQKKIKTLDEAYQDDFIIEIKKQHLANANDIIDAIVTFKKVSILNDLNNVCHSSYTYEYYANAILFFHKLKNFYDMGISPDNYISWYASLLDNAKRLQLFSSTEINLDCIPMHPADTIRDFYFFCKNTKFTLEVANIILNGLGKEEYKTMPHKTKREKELRQYLKNRNKLLLQQRKEIDKVFIQSGHIKRIK